MTAGTAFPWRVYLKAFALIALFFATPMIGGTLAAAIATANDCRLDAANAYPCPFLGVDLGQFLYTIGLLTWLMLITIPVGAAAGLGLAVVLVVHLVWHWFGRTR